MYVICMYVEIDTCAFQTGCQLSSAATGMSLELRFWHNFSGVKRTCWTTGSWRSCLSLQVVSSIPAGSTIIYRFLCGFICVSLCQSIKIKPTNMYVCMYSAEEHNLCPFDLNIACLCQSIEINNNKYVYRQSQVRKSTDSGVKWAECSLIIGIGCRVQVFSLILDSSVGSSASIQSAGDLVSGTPGSNPAFSRGTQLVSFRFEYRLPVPEHRN